MQQSEQQMTREQPDPDAVKQRLTAQRNRRLTGTLVAALGAGAAGFGIWRALSRRRQRRRVAAGSGVPMALPVDELALRRRVSQTSPSALRQRVLEGFARIEPWQWQEACADLLFITRESTGHDAAWVCREVGMSTSAALEMTADDVGALLAWARDAHPDLLLDVLVPRHHLVEALAFVAGGGST